MVLNESSDIPNSSCSATNPRPGIALFHRNAGHFSTMQSNNSQPQDQYESGSHQHNLAGKWCNAIVLEKRCVLAEVSIRHGCTTYRSLNHNPSGRSF